MVVHSGAPRLLLSAAMTAAVLVLSLTSTAAVPAAQDEPPGEEKLRQAVDDLGSLDPAERDAATRLLWSAAGAAEPLLREVVEDNDDFEVAARAATLLRRIRAGARPDTPKFVLDHIAAYESGDLSAKLGAARALMQTPQAVPILLRLWATEADPEAKRRVGDSFRGRSRQLVPLMLGLGDDEAAGTLLENDAGSSESGAKNYIVYLIVRGELQKRLGAAPPPDAAAANPFGWMHLAAGSHDAAQAIARRTNDDRLLQCVQYARGDWASLAERYEADADRFGDGENAQNLAAAFHAFAGNGPRLEAALRRVAAFAHKRPDAAFIPAEVFLLTGRVDEGIKLLKPRDTVAAFELLCHQLRFEEAFALLDRPGEAPPDRTALLTTAARWHHRLGEREAALARLDEALRPKPEQVDDDEAAAAARRIRAVVAAEVDMGLRDRAVERVLALGDDDTTAPLLAELFEERGGGGGGGASAGVWWGVLRQRFPDDTARQNFDRLDRLLRRTATAAEVRDWSAPAKALLASVPNEQDRAARLVAAAGTLLEYGLEAEAQDLLGVPAHGPVLADGFLALGDRAAKAQRWDVAERHYARAHALHDASPVALYLHGRAAAHAGRKAEGEAMMRRARIMPLNVDHERAALIRAMDERGLTEAAAAEREMVLRTNDFWPADVDDAARHAAQAAAGRKDWSAAADWLARSLLIIYRTEAAFRNVAGYLAVPHTLDDLRARAALDKGQTNEAVALVRSAAARFPADVDWTIRWVEEMRQQHGRKDVADELFAASLKAHQKVCERWPKAAQYHNSLAWLCARCGRELDTALAHATRAVELDGDNAAFLDTLAETHWRRGDNEKALQLMRRCVELEPESAGFRENLKRFASPPPKP